MTNLLADNNANFATSTGTWTSAQSGSNFTSSWSSADQKLRIDVTVGGTNIAMAHCGTGDTNKPAVTPGQVLTLSAKIRQAAGVTMRTVRLEGHFFDSTQTTPLATNALITAAGSQVTATTSEQTITGTLTVPAGAAYMRARWTIVNPAAGDVFLWDDMVLDDGIAPPPTYAEVIAVDAPVAWFRGHGNVNDSVAGGLAGTLANGATYGPALLPNETAAQSFQFDGVDDFISVPDQDKLDLLGPLTVEAWVQSDSVPPAGSFRAICGKGISSTSTAYLLQINDKKPEFAIRTASGIYRATATAPVAAQTTYHVAGVLTGSAMTLYVNGQATATATITGALVANTQPFRIGSINGTSEFLAGRVAEVAVYNTALSATRVNEHYLTGLGSIPPPAPAGNTVLDRWTGSALQRQRLDRWTGSALVQQRLDRVSGPSAPAPQPLANAAHAVIGGEDYTAQSPERSYSLAVVADPGAPTYSRHELRAGDRWINDINEFPNDARERCELRGNTYWPLETDIWLAGSLRVTASTWKPNEYNIITQFIQVPPSGEAGGQNSLNLSVENGILQIYTRGDTAAVTTVRPAAVTRFTRDWTPYLGQWVSLVIRARFSKASANGQLDVWLGGSQVIGATGIVMGFNNTQGPYAKHGIYRSGWADPIVVEWANREVGTASLLSRVTSPLPVPTY